MPFFHFTIDTMPLFFFLVQGLVFSFLLARKAFINHNPASGWLAAFIGLCCLYIVPWMCGYSGWYARDGYSDFLFFVPFQQLFFLGPVLYFYVQSLLNSNFRLRQKDYWHFLPGLLYLVYSLIIFIYDFAITEEYYFYADGRDKDMDEWYQALGFSSILVYTVLSIRYYRAYRKMIYRELSFADAINFQWVGRFLLAFLVILLVRFVFFVLFPGFGSFGPKWWYYIFFSAIAYYIALIGFMNSVESMVAFRVPAFEEDAEIIVPAIPVLTNEVAMQGSAGIAEQSDNIPAQPWKTVPSPTLVAKTSNNKTTTDEGLDEWKDRLIELVETQAYYQNPTLTLADLARALSTTTKQISSVINQGFGQNFNDFINQYRIQAVQKAFTQGQHKTQTILGVAFDCGFNSKTTFNRVFKKHTGRTPLAYLREKKLG